jgi:hypothetical protein
VRAITSICDESGDDSEGIRKDDSEETRLRDGGAVCRNANTGDDSRTSSEPLETQAGHLDESPPREQADRLHEKSPQLS